MAYRDKPYVAPNMDPVVLVVYPRKLEREPVAGDRIMLRSPIGTPHHIYDEGTVFEIVGETNDAPHGMADPYYSNFLVRTPHGQSVWSSIRLMLAEGVAELVARTS